MKTLIMLLLSSLIPILFINGCSESNSNTSPTIFGTENAVVSSYMDEAESLAIARYEGEELISEALGVEWREKDWGPNEIINLLGIDGASKLLAKINDLNVKIIGPALEQMAIYGEDLTVAEQEVSGLINFAPNRADTYVSEPRFVFLTAFAILSAFTSAGLAVAYEFKKNQNSNTGDPVTDLVESISDYKDYAWTAGSTFVISGATDASTSILGAAAKAKNFVALAVGIDVASTVKSAYDYASVIIGIQDESSTSTKALSLFSILQRVQRADAGTYYIGSSDKYGVFKDIPQGDWSFVITGRGLVRDVIHLSLENSSSVVVPMKLINEINEDIDDDVPAVQNGVTANIYISGHSGTFTSISSTTAFGLDNGYPGFVAHTNQETDGEDLEDISDMLIMKFDTTLKAGKTYTLSRPELGSKVVLGFNSPQVRTAPDKNGNQYNIGFLATSGTVTLEHFGTEIGDKISGSFTCEVEDYYDETGMNGSISGTFSGVLDFVWNQ